MVLTYEQPPSYQPGGKGTSISKIIMLTMSLHHGQELDYNLGARTDENLTFTGSFGIIDCIKCIIEDTCSDHIVEILNWHFMQS